MTWAVWISLTRFMRFCDGIIAPLMFGVRKLSSASSTRTDRARPARQVLRQQRLSFARAMALYSNPTTPH